MAQIEPFSCKHCGKKAEAFRHMRLRFSQMQYEHSYGRNYPKPSKTVDHGEVPVFLCDSCVRLYVREQYQERIFIGIKAAAYALIFLCIAVPIAYEGTVFAARVLCFVAPFFFLGEIGKENRMYERKAAHMTRNLPTNTYWGRKETKSMQVFHMSENSKIIARAVASGLFMLVSWFIPSRIYWMWVCLMGLIVTVVLAGWLVVLVKSNRMLKSPDHLRYDAIKYFFKMDDGIELY